MQVNRKAFVTVLAVVILSATSKSLFAQYPGMAAFRAQQSMQFANQQMMMQMRMLNGNYGDYNPAYTFVVEMKDGSKKEFDSKIYHDTVLKKNYLLLVDKNYKRSDTNRYKKIYPSQTVSIARNIAAPANLIHKNAVIPKPVYFAGQAADSCWMFKVISGPITAYSYMSQQEDDQIFNPYTIVAIQLNDGLIVKYTEENLKQMVGEDINALVAIKDKNYYKAIKKYNKDIEKAAKK